MIIIQKIFQKKKNSTSTKNKHEQKRFVVFVFFTFCFVIRRCSLTCCTVFICFDLILVSSIFFCAFSISAYWFFRILDLVFFFSELKNQKKKKMDFMHFVHSLDLFGFYLVSSLFSLHSVGFWTRWKSQCKLNSAKELSYRRLKKEHNGGAGTG